MATDDEVVVRLRLADVKRFVADVKSGAASIEDLEKKVDRAGGTARMTAGDNGFGRLTAVMGAVTRAAGVMGAAMAVASASLAASSVQAFAAFDQQLRTAQAVTGATTAQRMELSALAKELGGSTVFSAGEAADAILELAKGGMDVATIKAGGLAGTLTLAAAGGTELTTAATIASNAMAMFNLQGDQMASVADALAGGANASTASIETLGQALSQVGPGAKIAGWSLQETVAALSAFDANGIKGSDAGTSLKTMLDNLVPMTDRAASTMERLGLKFTNADGSFKSLTEVAGALHASLAKVSDAQRSVDLYNIFGSDAKRAGIVLGELGEKGLKPYLDAVGKAGGATQVADARMAGLAGTLEKVKGAWETMKITVGEALSPQVIAGGEKLAKALDRAGKTAPARISYAGSAAKAAGKGDAAAAGAWASFALTGDGSITGPMTDLVKIGQHLAEIWSGAVAPAFQDVLDTLGRFGGAGGALETLEQTTGFLADHTWAVHQAINVLVPVVVGYKVAVVGINATLATHKAITDLVAAAKGRETAATNAQRVAAVAHTAAVKTSAAVKTMWNSVLMTGLRLKAMDAAAWARSTVKAVAHRVAVLAATAQERAYMAITRARFALERAATAVTTAATAAWNASKAAVAGAVTASKAWLAAKAKEALAWVKSTALTVKDTAVIVAHKVATLAASAATKAWAIATTAWGIALKIAGGPVFWIITGIGLLIAGVVLAYKKFPWFRDACQAALKGVKVAFGWVMDGAKAVWGWLKHNWPLIKTIITGPVGAAAKFVIKHWDDIVKSVTGLRDRITGAAKGMWDGITGTFKAVINGLIDMWNRLRFKVPAVDVPGIGKVGGQEVGVTRIEHLAQGGTSTTAGVVEVGDAGRELVFLPPAATVIPNHRVPDFRRGESKTLEIHVHQHLDGREIAESVHRVDLDTLARL